MPKDFQDYEFDIPYKTLVEHGFIVDVAGLTPGNAVGAYGFKFTPNLELSGMKESDFDDYAAMVIPGGPGSSTYLWNNEALQNAVWYFNDKKKIVAAICHATAVLAQAGLLTGKQATVYPDTQAKAIFAQHEVTFVDQGCVTLKEEKIITAQSPKFIKEFCNAIISLLKE